MREYKPKKDLTAKNYYKDRFFVNKESVKSKVEDTKFKGDLDELSEVEILDSYVEFGQLVVFVNKEQNLNALKKFKECGYAILSEVSGIDFIDERGGIEVFYQLLDIKKAKRARLKCFVKNREFLQSAAGIFISANWAERELYDMMGVWLSGHPNLSRILMPNDWHGYPLLKSYPLQGDEHAKWYEIDRIFGKEYRDVVGPENRDPAFIDSKDTFNFSQIFHETEYGGEKPDKPYLQEYQEDGGVRFVKHPKRDKFKLIKKRQ